MKPQGDEQPYAAATTAGSARSYFILCCLRVLLKHLRVFVESEAKWLFQTPTFFNGIPSQHKL